MSNNPENSSQNSSQITEMISDLHWALRNVPMDGEYFNKLELYAEQLVTKYNWVKVNQYSSYELLDLLPIEARILTVDNQIAVKHETGWVLLSKEGYIFSRVETKNLGLPAFSLPQVDSHKNLVVEDPEVDKFV